MAAATRAPTVGGLHDAPLRFDVAALVAPHVVAAPKNRPTTYIAKNKPPISNGFGIHNVDIGGCGCSHCDETELSEFKSEYRAFISTQSPEAHPELTQKYGELITPTTRVIKKPELELLKRLLAAAKAPVDEAMPSASASGVKRTAAEGPSDERGGPVPKTGPAAASAAAAEPAAPAAAAELTQEKMDTDE